MALQDLCGFQDSLDSKWDLQTGPGMSQDGSFMLLGTRSRNNSSGGSWANPGNPLNFYVPVAEYLHESPIQFGQIRPSVAAGPTAASLPDSILSLLSSSPSAPLPFPLSHGTTTLAFLFQGGVIAAADTRSSCSGLVACPASQKILPVHSHLVGTTSGTSADCALWKRILSRELRLYQLRHGRRLSTAGAAKLLSHMLHPFKGTELCVAATLCGWDGGEVEATCPDHAGSPGEDLEEDGRPTKESENEELDSVKASGPAAPPPPVAWRKSQCLSPGSSGRKCPAGGRQGFSGPSLYYVCSDGARLQGELFSVGSGSPYAYSVLDGGVRWGLSVEEAVAVAREAVYRATHRDAYSGNFVDLYHVTSRGWRRRPREELKEEYYREKERDREKLKERRDAMMGIYCDHSPQILSCKGEGERELAAQE